jgi:hypothetical protein
MLMGCSSTEAAHPWLDLGESSAHQIVEFAGADAGQIVIAMEPGVTREEALALGRRIQAQAPTGARVNARLYNDEFTARGWRTAPAQMRVEHLLVLVSINPETGLNEVRWAPPDEPPGSIEPATSQSGVPSSDTN